MNRTWRPALSIIATDGIPSVKDGGNVLRPYTTLKLSLRLPPGLDGEQAQQDVERLLTENVPYNAKVTLDFEEPATGWHAPINPQWFDELMNEASMMFYGKPSMYMGEGGSIPFMYMLGEKFPKAHFVITGVLGPASNAHGPNEFIHIGYSKKLTSCISHILTRYVTASND